MKQTNKQKRECGVELYGIRVAAAAASAIAAAISAAAAREQQQIVYLKIRTIKFDLIRKKRENFLHQHTSFLRKQFFFVE